jgi:hypothetical protein
VILLRERIMEKVREQVEVTIETLDDKKEWKAPTLSTLDLAQETLGDGGSGGDTGGELSTLF